MRIRDCFQVIALQIIVLQGIGLQCMALQSFSSSSKNIGNKYAQGFSGTEMGPKT